MHGYVCRRLRSLLPVVGGISMEIPARGCVISGIVYGVYYSSTCCVAVIFDEPNHAPIFPATSADACPPPPSQEDPTRYLPAWGGFCSYGIAHESVWNEANLGPASNPDYWLMVDGVLHLFRR